MERAKATLGKSETPIERLNGAKEVAETARVNQERLLQISQSYASELETKLANLEKEQSSNEAV